MTTITTTDRDKHGTFTNGEQRFTGTVSYVGPVEVTALIDGAGSVVFLPRDNWDFTPDPDLPSAPGFYTDVYGDLWHRDNVGKWRYLHPDGDSTAVDSPGGHDPEFFLPLTLVEATA